jgi:uncharacterized protein YbjT (DUF2867 family)
MKPLILLTGATGYIGNHLLKLLESENQSVRCIVRRLESLRGRVGSGTTVVAGNLLDAHSMEEALQGVHTAYYLVHSMGAAHGFEEMDRQAAIGFGTAAHAQGVRRIIYLGGIGDRLEVLSPHLRSRQEVGEILRQSGVPVIEFRASIVIGSGSLSFEMIRALVERLPFMITPRWVNALAQPIAISDVLQYLRAALDLSAEESVIYEIGGKEQISYGGMMREYARQRGLHRAMISVPVLSPRLSSLWLGLVTPLYARIGRRLVESMRHSTVVTDTSALRVFAVRPIGMQQAIAHALTNEDSEYAETCWSDALSAVGPSSKWGGIRFGNRIVDSQKIQVAVSATAAFAPIQCIGGSTGWYFGNWLWTLRGWIDLLMGGIGMRRGRRHAEQLQTGDTVDFWRVESFEPGKRLLLAAEIKFPGRAWLQFEVTEEGEGVSIRQTSIFDPVGLAGILYWYSTYPLHRIVFAGMLRAIAGAAQTR